jgi:prepilin-type N-terminal cleavage/methylation domain-containing protein
LVVEQKLRSSPSDGGFSLLELVIVVALLTIMAAFAVPQVISMRRVVRFNGLQREIMSQLRLTRQLAMSQRQVMRFRYDNTNKQILIIDNQERGTAANPIANSTSNDVIVKTTSLAGLGVPAGEIAYGQPSGAPTSLPDGVSLNALSNGLVEVIFQPDGSVLNSSGSPSNAALFFYDNKAPAQTAIAISVLGAGGRVKNWRYSPNASVYVY